LGLPIGSLCSHIWLYKEPMRRYVSQLAMRSAPSYLGSDSYVVTAAQLVQKKRANSKVSEMAPAVPNVNSSVR